MLVKICGLRNTEEAGYLRKAGADYAGMVVFFPKSKRNIDIGEAKAIMEALGPDIKKVAVTVSPDATQVMAICLADFDIIQVHGKLSAEAYELCSIPIWKAFNINDMDSLPDYVSMDKIQGFVFDSAAPGSGKPYDLSILDNIASPEDKLFILAGGLNEDNVAGAVLDVRPDVVDVSTGVEYLDKPGKDPDRIAAFVDMARSALEKK